MIACSGVGGQCGRGFRSLYVSLSRLTEGEHPLPPCAANERANRGLVCELFQKCGVTRGLVKRSLQYKAWQDAAATFPSD
jgi:hypothetical protein